MATGAAAAVVYRQARVIKQAPAKPNFLRHDSIGIGHRWWSKAWRQMPVELNFANQAIFTLRGNGRAGSHKCDDAGNDAEPPTNCMN